MPCNPLRIVHKRQIGCWFSEKKTDETINVSSYSSLWGRFL